MWVAFANAKGTHFFFSKSISVYAIFNDHSFNDTLTNGIISFEQLGPGQKKSQRAPQRPATRFDKERKTLELPT